ncbi:SDR family NAD(P)-dependent oxidoreductase [Microbacterium sp. 18062]|uniref:SDR family NAD(P)-dependent oxidoreductase n=1 Tax=Microbacterium sp. 18062 TaxID=2681410 RepID=UPI0027D2A487|nr:SDR family oxidoreductase [Microbacterium sp. 18062]
MVVGGGHGIGRATAEVMAREGAHVVVADADAQSAQEAACSIRAGGGSAEGHEVDATDASSIGRFFYALGEGGRGVDVLVNCPAHATDTHFERFTEGDLDLDLTVTLKAPFLCIQAAMPLLLKSDAAAVVSVGSVNGLGAFGNEAYGAAKAGLINLTKNLALRYGPHRVRFNVVAPGSIHTGSWDERMAAEPDILDRVSRVYPMRRLGTVDDVAAACAFLASSDAAWITGTTLTVDGGITAGNSELIAAIFGEEFFQTTFDERPVA